MSGPNQHHIPVFLQKGFAIPKTRAKKIWVWQTGQPPSEDFIKKTGAEINFYLISVDEKITDLEDPLARVVQALRELPVGSRADATKSAACVMHLSLRTAHLRGTFEAGLSQFMQRAATSFNDLENLANFLGMNTPRPTKILSELIWEEMNNHLGAGTLQVPKDVSERMAFAIAREHFFENPEAILQSMHAMFKLWGLQCSSVARYGHNKALQVILETTETQRFEFLAALDWRVDAAPPEGAILPDCVVLAVSENGKAGPYMHLDRNHAHVIVMPITTTKLLVDTQSGVDIPDISNINEISASASYAFFLSSSGAPAIAALQPLISSRSTQLFDQAVREFESYPPFLATESAKIQGQRPKTRLPFNMLVEIKAGNSCYTTVID